MSKFVIDDIDINEVNTIISGLMELPGKVSIGLYLKIRQQVESQSNNQTIQSKSEPPEGPLSDKVVQ